MRSWALLGWSWRRFLTSTWKTDQRGLRVEMGRSVRRLLQTSRQNILIQKRVHKDLASISQISLTKIDSKISKSSLY